MSRPNDPEAGTVPEVDRTLLPFAVGPLRNIGTYQQVPMWPPNQPPRTMVAWGLCVGAEVVAWDFVLGEASEQDIARHLMRKWLGVQP